MATETLLIFISVALALLMGVLIALLVGLHKHVTSMVAILRSIHHEAMPLMGDVRDISYDIKNLAQEMRVGMVRVNKVTQALGGVGDDLEQGRRAVKSTLQDWREKLVAVTGRLRRLRQQADGTPYLGGRP